MKPQISIDQFNYDLPEIKIAKYPLENRDISKLLVYKSGKIVDDTFRNINQFLPQGAMIVFNDTKVIRARLIFNKPTGARIEIFCLEPAYQADVQESFASIGHTTWRCFIGNAKKWKNEPLTRFVNINGNETILSVTKTGEDNGSVLVKFSWDSPHFSFGELLDALGQTPIPPYLNRESETIDEERYQTVYSAHKGSVAAPTAGLHFTDEIIGKLKETGAKVCNVTLHVGAGTFKPVKAPTIDEHEMHIENFSISKEALIRLHDHTGPMIAVGTTTVRTLESLYWLGNKINSSVPSYFVKQWDPYLTDATVSYKTALNTLIDHLEQNGFTHLNAQTAIMIAPGYKFRAIDALVTNFHQPQSTLLLLIAALIGDNWKKVYTHALDNNYRFLSYGDSSLLFQD
ncbi:MAG: S-adenosylmethionine:tRNA ribosyltransferase-isomerase [Breznakibacter sp.]